MSRLQYTEIQQFHSYFSHKTKFNCYQTLFKKSSKQIWRFNFSGNDIPDIRGNNAGRFQYQIAKHEGDFFYLKINNMILLMLKINLRLEVFLPGNQKFQSKVVRKALSTLK
jgi:hypothetical protein